MDRKYNKSIIYTAKMLLKTVTKEEKHLWYDYLRRHPARFTRQKVLGKYIADFYSARAQLGIELDGSGHATEAGLKHDAIRTAFLEEMGLSVIRIPNGLIWRDFSGVCEYLDDVLRQFIPQDE